ncbi:MAG: hypothetical protein LBH66_02105 [Oscillospiraceae bacterium]|jgi:RNA-binding protein YlmH|nr:hypothetical protein [Oscillospiraceae bacterium]
MRDDPSGADALERRLNELAARVSGRGGMAFTLFLDPAQQSAALRAANRHGMSVAFWGGYDGAERRVGAITPRGDDYRDGGAVLDWPVSCVRASWAEAYGSPSHRDLLGASLAVVQDRARFGDIVMNGGYALLFCLAEVAGYIADSLDSAGRVKLKCALEHDPQSSMPDQERDRREFRDTIPSFRLDACVASAFKLSRGQAQALIREGRVKLNHLPEPDADAKVGEGGLLSVRGLGRALLKERTGVNRKGRFSVVWIRTAL